MQKELFISHVAAAIQEGHCELFVGSGISQGCGFPGWANLLKPIAQGYGFDLDYESDLPLLAQYIINENSGNRNILRNVIRQSFSEHRPISDIHRILRDMDIRRIWTTNYDFLLEDAYSEHEPLHVIRKDDDLQQTVASNMTQLIKMHGSADELGAVVLTREDYDNYFESHCFIKDCFQASITQNSILFIGYSYSDPDIRAIMVRMQKIHQWTHDHYLITRRIIKDQDETEIAFGKRKRIFEAWIKELARIGIHVLLIDEYSELYDILLSISMKSRGKTVYITGSHSNEETPKYEEEIVKLLMEQNAILINGQSAGIGSSYLNSFCRVAIEHKLDICKQIRFFVNPYSLDNRYSDDETLIPELKRVRRKLFKNVRLMLAYPGGMGTKVEYELACESGCRVLPIVVNEDDYNQEMLSPFIESVDINDDTPLECRKYYDILRKKEIPLKEDVLSAIKGALR